MSPNRIIPKTMDAHLQKLKRDTIQNPGDVHGLQRYITALERALGGVKGSEIKDQRRPGWECPDPEHKGRCWCYETPCTCESKPYIGAGGSPGSPDGVCIYASYLGEADLEGRRFVRLMIDGKWVEHLLPASYTGHIDGESDDWCIFCGEPDERK